jgi:hypothetical protein
MAAVLQEGAKLSGVPGSATAFTALGRWQRGETSVLKGLFGANESQEPGLLEEWLGIDE